MTVASNALVEAIETSIFVYPEIPGAFEMLRERGLRGRITAVSHPLANLVGDAHLSASEADATIRRVRERFARERKMFGWITGPSTRPDDLPSRLQAAGLMKAEELAGMALHELALPIETNPALEVREAFARDAPALEGVMVPGYGLPLDVVRVLNAAFFAELAFKRRIYLAYFNGEPIAAAYLVNLPGSSIVLLGGAATLPEHRGKGAYTALVAKRLADARSDGAEAAVIQAVRSTSAPICRNLGFEELCALELYAWFPPT